MRLILMLLLIMISGTALFAQNAGVYLYSSSVPHDLVIDINDFLTNSLQNKSNLKFVPREKLVRMFEKVTNIKPEVCIKLDSCIKENADKLMLRLIITGQIVKDENLFSVMIIKYSLTGGKDQTYVKEGLKDIPAILEYLKSIQAALLKSERALVNVSGGAGTTDASIFIDGKLIGVLPYSHGIVLSGGLHKLLVRKIGYNDFKSKFSCSAGQKCTLKVALTKTEKKVSKKEIKPKVIAKNSSVTVKKHKQNKHSKTLLWLGVSGIGAGTILAGVGIYFYMSAQNDVDYLNNNCSNATGSYYPSITSFSICNYSASQKNSKLDSANKNLTMSYIMIGTGATIAVAGIGSIIAYVLRKQDKNKTGSNKIKLLFTPVFNSRYAGFASRFQF